MIIEIQPSNFDSGMGWRSQDMTPIMESTKGDRYIHLWLKERLLWNLVQR